MQNITRLFDFIHYQLEHHPLEKAFVTKKEGKWIATSTQKFVDQANAISRGLLRLGVKQDDRVGLISMTNRTEWSVMDVGILQLGAHNVPIYPTISEEDYAYVLTHSESKFCFVSCREVYDKIKKIKDTVPTLQEVYCFDELTDCKNWSEVLELGADTSNQDEVEKAKNAVDGKDLATLIYTSGTTGRPKGVMLSHENVVSNVLASEKRVPFDQGGVALSFLPVCHIFERMILYLYQFCGIEVHFAERIDTISENLKEVKPHVMTVVPRLLEKVYEKIVAKGSELTGIKRKLFFWAIGLGVKFEPYEANGWWYKTKLKLARKLIFSKWLEALGGNLETMVSGSAALQARLARVFCCCWYSGYGGLRPDRDFASNFG